MIDKRKNSGRKVTASRTDSRRITIWTSTFAALATAKKNAVAKIDPGRAAICAAIITASATAIPATHKLWVGIASKSEIEELVWQKEKNYSNIESDLKSRAAEMQALRDTPTDKDCPEATKQKVRSVIDEYLAANQSAQLRLEKNHVENINALRADRRLNSESLERETNKCLFEEATKYNHVTGGAVPELRSIIKTRNPLSPIIYYRKCNSEYSFSPGLKTMTIDLSGTGPARLPVNEELIRQMGTQVHTKESSISHQADAMVVRAPQKASHTEVDDLSFEFREGLPPR